MLSFIVTNNGTINAVANGKAYVVPQDHHNYAAIKDAIVQGDADALEKLANVAGRMASFAQGSVEVKDGQVFFMGKLLHNSITQRIVNLMNEGFPFKPMVAFLDNLMQNPSFRSVTELYNFLEHKALPITEDGHFLAYKRVRDDWKDFHSGTFDNSVGQVLEMPRNTVDDNCNNGCSYGFHVGSINYVQTFNSGGHVLICKVNPKDVVSVPTDCNNQKVRTCRYEVIKEYEGDLTAPLYTARADEAPKEEPKPEPKSEAYLKGYNSYATNETNAHLFDSVEYRYWNAGWYAAQNDGYKSEEYRQGYDAHENDDDNPYPDNTLQYKWWNLGFQTAENDDDSWEDDDEDFDDDEDSESDFSEDDED